MTAEGRIDTTGEEREESGAEENIDDEWGEEESAANVNVINVRHFVGIASGKSI